MKAFSAPENHDAAGQQKAWGCFTTNLVFPGLGSLVGGRKSGYAQLVFCFAGMALTLVCGVRFVFWSVAHWSEFHNPDADPVTVLHDLWVHARWPLLGMVMFAIAWLWSLLTSRLLVNEAKKKSAGG